MRPEKDETFLVMALVIAKRSSCVRRRVGCVLVDDNYRVLAMGHNGVPRGYPHCTDQPCAGSKAKSGASLDLCEAIHAEQNALMFCQDVMKIATCYVTTSPCIHCVKMLLNTSCKRIVFIEKYSHDDIAKDLWTKKGSWEQMSLTKEQLSCIST